MEPYEMAMLAVKALDDKKARNIKVLKTEKQTVLADYFVICNGTSFHTYQSPDRGSRRQTVRRG